MQVFEHNLANQGSFRIYIYFDAEQCSQVEFLNDIRRRVRILPIVHCSNELNNGSVYKTFLGSTVEEVEISVKEDLADIRTRNDRHDL